jgi:hypothetical protein
VEPRLSITEYVTKQIKGNNNLWFMIPFLLC